MPNQTDYDKNGNLLNPEYWNSETIGKESLKFYYFNYFKQDLDNTLINQISEGFINETNKRLKNNRYASSEIQLSNTNITQLLKEIHDELMQKLTIIDVYFSTINHDLNFLIDETLKIIKNVLSPYKKTSEDRDSIEIIIKTFDNKLQFSFLDTYNRNSESSEDIAENRVSLILSMLKRSLDRNDIYKNKSQLLLIIDM